MFKTKLLMPSASQIQSIPPQPLPTKHWLHLTQSANNASKRNKQELRKLRACARKQLWRILWLQQQMWTLKTKLLMHSAQQIQSIPPQPLPTKHWLHLTQSANNASKRNKQELRKLRACARKQLWRILWLQQKLCSV